MDYEPKGPTKTLGVSPMPVYGVISSLASIALIIIGKYLLKQVGSDSFYHETFTVTVVTTY